LNIGFIWVGGLQLITDKILLIALLLFLEVLFIDLYLLVIILLFRRNLALLLLLLLLIYILALACHQLKLVINILL